MDLVSPFISVGVRFLSPLSKLRFSAGGQCWWHTVCSEFQVGCAHTLPSARRALLLSYAQACGTCSHLLALSPCSCLALQGAWGWAVVPRMALCSLLLSTELARHQMGTWFGWWQPAEGHHLPWGSSLSPACSAQLVTERFIEGSWRQQWVAAVLLTLGGTWKMTRKAEGFVKCVGGLHPSFSGLVCVPWSNWRLCHGVCVWRLSTAHKQPWNLMLKHCGVQELLSQRTAISPSDLCLIVYIWVH